MPPVMKAASLKPEVALLDSKYIHIQYKKKPSGISWIDASYHVSVSEEKI
jgi:hypothetical protein